MKPSKALYSEHLLKSFQRPSSLLGKILLVIVGFLSSCQSQAQETAIDFEVSIRPILTKYCVSCHGPTKQEGSLRLDRRESAFRGGDNYAPSIVAGDASASSLFRFVADSEADLKMPPKGEQPNADEIETLKKWIDQGAEWPADPEIANDDRLSHWSFQQVVSPTLSPTARDWIAQRKKTTDWDSHSLGTDSDVRQRSLELDAMIAERLMSKGLTMSRRADRVTLIRRLHLVMIGLPPSPEEVDSFVSDTSPDAWPKLVEKILASPHYGERWGQHWLDVVRFGETNGFETNRERPSAWLYRDYVIQAFNEDKSYDQFVREQIAGDVFGQEVGTGFLVAGPYDLVKSQDKNLTLMQRQDELTDMINATGTVFLGLTVGCAKCHNHKFDPILQSDFYALQAILAGVQHGERPLSVPENQKQYVADLDQLIADRSNKLLQFQPVANPDFVAQAERSSTKASDYPREKIKSRVNLERIKPTSAKFVRFTILATNGSQPCIDELRVFSEGKNVALAAAGTKATCSSELPGHAIHKLAHIHDGLVGNSHSWISNTECTGWVQLELPQETVIDRIEWGRDAEGQFQDRVAIDYKIDLAVEPDRWSTVATSKDRVPFATPDTDSRPRSLNMADFPKELAEQGAQWQRELDQAIEERRKLQSSLAAYIGRFEQPGPTFRLFRGEPLQPKEEVGPNTIKCLGSLDLTNASSERDRRAKLADWLAQPTNPLTARVWVNRVWQYHFGRGIVDTPNDFGANGALPSHPDVLDWLATELISNGWSTKHLHRVVLLSDAWQQDNRPQTDGLKIDGDSRLLWRFPTRRIEAELIRDSMLAVSGVLDLRMGGPGFDGFEVQMENVRHYLPKREFTSKDFRRMIYMTKVRMERESTFGIFDCPDASQAVAKRSQSTTPMQALNLLNSQFVLQQAGLFANRLQSQSERADQQVTTAFQLCFGRIPTATEQAECEQFIAENNLQQFCRALFNANEFLFIP
jgi:Protein of unknown function (DUF1553)/Protein of unknown function (DUF1549)/Planctomycete cytochrome C